MTRVDYSIVNYSLQTEFLHQKKIALRVGCATWRHFALYGALLAVCATGCWSKPRDVASQSAERSGKEVTDATPEHQAGQSGRTERELWYINFILGERAGYERQVFRRITTPDGPGWECSSETHLRVKRSQSLIEVLLRCKSWETEDGQVQRFEVESVQDHRRLKTTGEVRDGQLLFETQLEGRTVRQVLPYPAGCRGFFGIPQTLLARPMRPGEVREFPCLVPEINAVATVRLTAEEYELLETAPTEERCLRIRVQIELPEGTTVPGTLWVDKSGLIVQQETQLPPTKAVRASREEALRQLAAPTLDLIRDVRIPVKNRAAKDVSQAARAVYRLSTKPGTTIVTIPTDTNQSMQRVNEQVLQVTAKPVRLPLQQDSCGEQAPDDALSPNLWIQSDAEEIQRLAGQAAAGESDPARIALALEQAVHRTVIDKGYDQAFLSALEVAREKKGDCTEHAVLLAALARAKGIPSRVAVGLVFHGNAFYYHMWTEVLLNGCWIGLDATRGQGGISAGYIKLGDSTLGQGDAMSVALPVIQFVGQLEIEILSAE